MFKRLPGYLKISMIALGAIISLGVATDVSAATRYCDDNSIIRCGALTADELQEKYTANTTGDLDDIYAHYGISSSMIAGAGSAKVGTVKKNGEVIVDGKVVATNAQSVGRQHVEGSTAVNAGGTTIYQRPTNTVFIDEEQMAFVFLDSEGQFLAAIIGSCGNPVTATATPKPKPQAVPNAICVNLSADRIERNRYTFDARADVDNGATISRYVVTVRKDSATGAVANTLTVNSTDDHVETEEITLEPGTYYASAVVTTSVGDKTHEDCTTTLTVEGPELVTVCNPETGETITVNEEDKDRYESKSNNACEDKQVCELSTKKTITIKASDYDSTLHSENSDDCKEVTPPVIAKTGPAEFIGGGLALGSLTAAGYYWNASRRTLIDKFLGR